MSNVISMIVSMPLLSFIFLWCCPSICYSAALIRPRSGHVVTHVNLKYKIMEEKNLSNFTPCPSKYNDNTTHNMKCLEVKGAQYRLNFTEDGFLHLRKDNKSTYIAPGQFCGAGRHSSKLCFTSDSSNFIWKKCCPKNQLVVDVDRTTKSRYHYSCATTSVPFQQGKLSYTTSAATDDQFSFSCPAGYKLKKFSTDTCGEQSMSRFKPSANGTIQYEISTGVFLRKSVWKTVDLSKNEYCLDGVMKRISSCGSTNNNHFPSTTATNFHQKQEPIQQYNVHVGSEGRHVEINNVENEVINKDNSDRTGSFYKKCDNSGDDGGNSEYNDNEPTMDSILFVCLKDDNYSPEASSDDVLHKTNTLAFIWSLTCPLLLAAALANCCIIQKNVHGWILTCYLLSMCFLNVLSVIVIVEIGNGESIGRGCRPVDFLIKLTYMSTLCWMSSINFGLHKTFRYTLPQPVGYRRFLSSVLFSLGFPVLSVSVCYYVANLSIDPSCGDLAYCVLFIPITIPYYSVPMLLLVLGNFAIFLKTSYTITTLRKEADDVLQRQAQDHLKSFALFAKLFLLTGGIWLLRVVLFILQVKGLYLSWYGVMLEIVFSVPEVIFPMIVFHHSEFIKWCWNKAPVISSLIYKINPFFHVPTSK